MMKSSLESNPISLSQQLLVAFTQKKKTIISSIEKRNCDTANSFST